MTFKEILTYYTFNFRTAVHSTARLFLREEIEKFPLPENLLILDIGGRNSPYTCGLPGKFVVSDLPRESEVQTNLSLGINNNIFNNLTKKRSNIKEVVFDDMTKTKMEAESFDGIITVEVIEHVPEDEKFVKNASKVLKKNGFLILTTPNGDAIPCKGNPDHIRHYTKLELENLLKKYFSNVIVKYVVPITKSHSMSLYAWSLKKPLQTLKAMLSGYKSFKETKQNLEENNKHSMHLLAIAYK